LGRGLGTWSATKYQVFDNQYLLSLVEVGVLGTVAFMGIFLAGLYAALRARFMSPDPCDRDLGLTLAAMLVVPLLACATFDFASFKTASSLGFLVVGASGSLLRTVRSSPAVNDGAINDPRSNVILQANVAGVNVSPDRSRTERSETLVISPRR
jgi:O-antigen ligase